MDKKFHFANYELSVNHNLKRWLERFGWKRALFPLEADFCDQDMHLNEAMLAHLEEKHLLARLLEEANLPFMPESYVLENVINLPYNFFELSPKPSGFWVGAKPRATGVYVNVHEDCDDGEGNNPKSQRVQGIWFLKPALLNNGIGIQVFDSMEKISAFFQQPNRYSGPHVLQKGIEPHLYEGKKWSIRRLVILNGDWSYQLYEEGYANISALPYESNPRDKRCQITNYLLDNKMAGISQKLLKEMPLSETHWQMMEKMIDETLESLKRKHPTELLSEIPKAFTLLGFDFILSNEGQLWLLEINHGMDCPKPEEHPLYKTLWAPFWKAIIRNRIERLVS